MDDASKSSTDGQTSPQIQAQLASLHDQADVQDIPHNGVLKPSNVMDKGYEVCEQQISDSNDENTIPRIPSPVSGPVQNISRPKVNTDFPSSNDVIPTFETSSDHLSTATLQPINNSSYVCQSAPLQTVHDTPVEMQKHFHQDRPFTISRSMEDIIRTQTLHVENQHNSGQNYYDEPLESLPSSSTTTITGMIS